MSFIDSRGFIEFFLFLLLFYIYRGFKFNFKGLVRKVNLGVMFLIGNKYMEF